MAIDKLQDKIRKLKNPAVIDFSITPDLLPPHILQSEGSFLPAYERFCMELMGALKATVPAVRFGFDYFALFGPEGLNVLQRVTAAAREQGYSVFLDGPEMLSGHGAACAANILLCDGGTFIYDGLILVSYIGSDGLRPYIDKLKSSGKDLFMVVRTANKSASELQDLLTGSRLVHMARADMISRYVDSLVGKCGYSSLSVMAAASSADSLRNLRSKYKSLFLLLDGYDYTNANAKNCANAFDKLGHGAAVCAGLSVIGAWKAEESDGWQFAQQALAAAERMKKNIGRYVTIL